MPVSLQELRDQRADAEDLFKATMAHIAKGNTAPEVIAQAIGYHREVTVLFTNELGLITHGKLPTP